MRPNFKVFGPGGRDISWARHAEAVMIGPKIKPKKWRAMMILNCIKNFLSSSGMVTPPKTSMEPKNWWLVGVSSFRREYFQVPCQSGCIWRQFFFKLIPGVNYSVKSLVVNFCDTVDGKHPAPKEMLIMGHLPYQPVGRISEASTVVRVSPLFQKIIGYGKIVL